MSAPTPATQWEVVGKNKKNKTNGLNNKLSKSEKKKFVENAPKAEDILPAMEVKTLYTALSKPKDKTKETAAKQVTKQVKEAENNRKQGSKKPAAQQPPVEKKKVPRGMEECIKALDVSELAQLVESGKKQFPQEPSVWLRQLATNLNTRLPNNPWTDAPTLTRSLLALCPAKLSKLLLTTLRELGPAKQAFFENCLSAIANDLSKSSPVNGWLLLAETLCHVSPELAVSNMARWSSLMHSYQNRPSIGGALLWALGQSGLRNLKTGLQVWEGQFLPVVDLRSYTRLVVDSLSLMLSAAAKRQESLDQYERILVKLCSLSSQGSVMKEVAAVHATLQGVASLNVPPTEMFLAQLSMVSAIPTSHPLRSQMLQSLAENLVSDLRGVSMVWSEEYRRHLVPSAALLRYLHSHWSNYKSALSNSKFKEFLIGLRAKNLDISGVKGADKEGFMECQRLEEDLLKKLSNMNRGFPWKMANFLLFLAITGLAAYDINKHGSFKSSSTGIFLENVGVLHYGQKAIETTKSSWNQAYEWGQKELPLLWTRYGEPTWVVVVNQSSRAASAVKVWALNVADWAAETWPHVANFIEQYAPGLLGKCGEMWSVAWGYTKQYSELGLNHARNATLGAGTWLSTNVFTGKLSAENLSRVSLEAYNATHTFALDTIMWISQKVLPATTKTA